jgi:hypothetical protein
LAGAIVIITIIICVGYFFGAMPVGNDPYILRRKTVASETIAPDDPEKQKQEAQKKNVKRSRNNKIATRSQRSFNRSRQSLSHPVAPSFRSTSTTVGAPSGLMCS